MPQEFRDLMRQLTRIADALDRMAPPRRLQFPERPDEHPLDPPVHPDDDRMRDEVRD